jgi:hypothetical protein
MSRTSLAARKFSLTVPLDFLIPTCPSATESGLLFLLLSFFLFGIFLVVPRPERTFEDLPYMRWRIISSQRRML